MVHIMKLWCYNDAHNWGQMLSLAASKRGHDVHLFDDPREPDQGYVFMHMHHHPQVRLLHKRVMAILSMNPELILIPDYRASVLFDDKLEQARQLARWTPRTRVFYTPGASRKFLTHADLPFVSKALDGASSHNVRMVNTLDDAKNEIKHSFSDLGIKCRYGQAQRGYLLWQDYIPGAAGDVRVIAIGNKRLILRRNNSLERPLANGSERITPIIDLQDRDIVAALDTANAFFDIENFNWAAVDVIKGDADKWHVLEMTVGWTMHGYYECAFIDMSSGTPIIMEERGAIFDIKPLAGYVSPVINGS
jgi:glutathione synthase/RimK-type ligase-like ATP-grasp enzyme